MKDDVGRAKPATRRLPSKDFAFGKTEKPEEGAGSIVNSWQENVPFLPDIRKSSQPRDFKLLNKRSAMQGMVTAKQNWDY